MFLYYSNEMDIANPIKVGEIVTNFEMQMMPKFIHLYNLYKGRHRILERKPRDDNKPNNKLLDDFYGYIVDTTVGYFLGAPIVVTLSKEEAETAQEELENIFTSNDKDDLFMEIGKECCIRGTSGLLVYQNEKSETKLIRTPADQCIFVYDENNPTELMAGIRFYYTVSNYGNVYMNPYDTTNPQRNNYSLNKRFVEVYTKDKIYYYITSEKSKTLMIDETRPVNPSPHIYGMVPMVPFYNNEEEIGDIEKIETLVDDFDRVFSDASNEQEAFRNAYMMIRNMVMSDDSLRKLKEEGVIEVMEDGDVKFVTKDMPTEATEKHLNRLEKNIFKFAQTPDLSDEHFAGNLSGVAIKFKLFGLETKCIIKERKMTKSIKRLLDILQVPLKVKTGVEIDLNKVNIKFTRNIPANITEIVDEVTKLQGMVDKETLLSLLPFIDDPQEVIDKLQKEQDVYNQDLNNPDMFDTNTNTGIQASIAARMGGEGNGQESNKQQIKPKSNFKKPGQQNANG